MATKNIRKDGAKKLSLNKETLRQLTPQALAHVIGGTTAPAPTPDCTLNNVDN
jgi:hypothetical protein